MQRSGVMSRIPGVAHEQAVLLEAVEAFQALNAEIAALNAGKSETLDRERAAGFAAKAFKRLVTYLEDPAGAEAAEDNLQLLLLGFNEAKAARDGKPMAGKPADCAPAVGTRHATRAPARAASSAPERSATDVSRQDARAAPASFPQQPAERSGLPFPDRTQSTREPAPAERGLTAARGQCVNGGRNIR
jgi:hypothetical protein